MRERAAYSAASAAGWPSRLLFGSHPWGNDEEGWSGDRYGGFTHPGKWRECVTAAYGRLRRMLKAPAILVVAVES